MGRPRIHQRRATLPVAPRRSLPETPRPGVVERDAQGFPLRVVWVRGDGSEHVRVELAFLTRAPAMAEPFATHLAARYTIPSSVESARTLAEQVRYGIVAFLDDTDRRHLAPTDLTLDHADAFERFVADMDVSETVKERRWDGSRSFLQRCAGAVRLPPSRWKRKSTETNKNALRPDELKRVLAAAAAEAMQTMARFDAQFDRSHPQWRTAADRPFLEVLANLRDHFTGPFPHLPAIRDVDRALWRRVSAAGWYELRTWWGPMSTNVAPFLILWLYWFRLNPSLAQTMLSGQVDLVDGEWVIVKGKPRSGRRQTPGYPDGDEPLGPGKVLEFLRRWTADVRRKAPREQRALLFVLWNWPKTETAPLGRRSTMTNVFGDFCERHDLPWLPAQMLRPSAIDVIGSLTGDDPDFRRATGQHTIEVNERNYRASETETRDRLRIGAMQMVRRRDHRSHPVVSAVNRVGHAGHAAATPGFTCNDPMNRRYSKSPPGDLCDAVGMCAVCHLGRPVLTSGYSLAHCYALLEAALAEVASGRPERMGRYAPVADRLETYWIPSFEDTARATMPSRIPSLLGCLP